MWKLLRQQLRPLFKLALPFMLLNLTLLLHKPLLGNITVPFGTRQYSVDNDLLPPCLSTRSHLLFNFVKDRLFVILYFGVGHLI
jgi:hypothetical protein